jgi:hypothetical protein
VTSENRGGADATAKAVVEDEVTFALCRGRLERSVRDACPPDRPWPGRVAAGIDAALRFADADRAAARILTIHSAFRRLEGGGAFLEMVDGFAELFSKGAPPTDRPDGMARTIVIRIARQTLNQIDLHPHVGVVEIAPDMIVFALIPYLGFAEAQRWSKSDQWSNLATEANTDRP